MTAEERSSSAGRPELDLDKERDDSKDDGAPVAGGLCRLDAPDSVTDKDPG
jgi:hypothetical protein